MIYVDGILLYTKIEICNFVPNNSQVETNSEFFCNTTPYRLVNNYGRFGGIHIYYF